MFKRCHHKWEIITEKTLASPFSQMSDKLAVDSLKGCPIDFFHETHIIIMSCQNCGEIYKSVEKNKL